MPKFFMTFGSGQGPHAGHVLPLIADDEGQARRYMWDKYDGRWCGTYTEEAWQERAASKPFWIPLERELPALDISTGKAALNKP